MFIINPDPYSLPTYRIGPFRTSDLSKNHCLPDSDLIEDYFEERFGGRHFYYTNNGRKAINLALSQYNLNREDIVTILTTSGNFYLSSCVTLEIEKFCKWSRTICPETKVILINHEFGFPYPDLNKLKDLKIPIIEDCAGAFFSIDRNNCIGNVGDFVIYSFPKIFPIQIGGLLLANTNCGLTTDYNIDTSCLRYIKNVLSQYINTKKSIIESRQTNYNYLKEKFMNLDLEERFKISEGIVPAVFMFKTEKAKAYLPDLKKYFYAHGIQCSVFYGEEAFFIPVHQALGENDLLYFFEVMRSYLEHEIK